MRCFNTQLQAILVIAGVAVVIADAELRNRKRQVGTAVLTDGDDREVAETGFSEAVQQGSKYFQYAHVPAKDHYEFGHRRGNDHHFIERHEKAHPHAGEFKTKVRWGDKHGGYGEHYWDYNHAGHGDGDGEESQHDEEYATYEGSEQVPVVDKNRKRRDAEDLNPDAEFINENARQQVESGQTNKHGGNYRAESDAGIKRKRQNYFKYEPKIEDSFVNYDY